MNPGVHKVIPPFNDVTSVTGVIPLILNASSYIGSAVTPCINATTTTLLAPLGGSATFTQAEYTIIILCPVATAFGKGTNYGVSSGIYVRQSYYANPLFRSLGYETMSTLFPGQPQSS